MTAYELRISDWSSDVCSSDLNGFCMGGGTEISLACDYRVASNDPSTRIGLPEVKLGIYPGWGGSVRLPRLVGAPAAFDMRWEARRVGKECVSTCRSRWSPYH